MADPSDRVWAIALFTHKRPKRVVNSRLLTAWGTERAGMARWLFDESYGVVGDLAETLALIVPNSVQASEDRPLTYWMEYLLGMQSDDEQEKKHKVNHAWDVLQSQEKYVFNKLLTGGFRVGASRNLFIKALAETIDVPATEVAHRLMGDWDPAQISFNHLVLQASEGENLSKPYPFYLAYPLEGYIESLKEPAEWQVEWKWDGIRSQTIKRGEELFIWSRGEDLITDKFPELTPLKETLPNGVVIDGELLPFLEHPLPFALLQTRIGRKTVTKKQLKEAPTKIMAYDLLEYEGNDIRGLSLAKRRELLKRVLLDVPEELIDISPEVRFQSWEELSGLRELSRDHYAEGFMLKHKDSVYQTGRKRGEWWKWKVDPLSIDAVMIYAQKGHGRRADVYSDYTFAVWEGEKLVPFAKAYSGLTDKEILEVTRFVKRNTVERFGPVRTVRPSQVFEIHFEGISESSRHKSGIAVRFPRIHRWRKDKKPEEANSLQDLKVFLQQYS